MKYIYCYWTLRHSYTTDYTHSTVSNENYNNLLMIHIIITTNLITLDSSNLSAETCSK